jgi:hypothetical protein
MHCGWHKLLLGERRALPAVGYASGNVGWRPPAPCDGLAGRGARSPARGVGWLAGLREEIAGIERRLAAIEQ